MVLEIPNYIRSRDGSYFISNDRLSSKNEKGEKIDFKFIISPFVFIEPSGNDLIWKIKDSVKDLDAFYLSSNLQLSSEGVLRNFTPDFLTKVKNGFYDKDILSLSNSNLESLGKQENENYLGLRYGFLPWDFIKYSLKNGEDFGYLLKSHSVDVDGYGEKWFAEILLDDDGKNLPPVGKLEDLIYNRVYVSDLLRINNVRYNAAEVSRIVKSIYAIAFRNGVENFVSLDREYLLEDRALTLIPNIYDKHLLDEIKNSNHTVKQETLENLGYFH
ncbi:MAG: hypothetical protein KC550_04430 [Nanoarchaeota archaeon]|nr:hypothetical protein [Nanoarchaeota archaeon]